MSETPSTSSLDFMRSVMSLSQDGSSTFSFDMDGSFAFPQTERGSFLRPSRLLRGDQQQTAAETAAEYEHVPWRVFLNCVDTFNSKHIARFLCEQEYGILKPPEIDEEEQESVGEDLYNEMDFLFEKKVKEQPEMQNYIILGSLLDPDAVFDRDNIHIVDTSNKESLLERLSSCGFIIYDISRYPSQIEEAKSVLRAFLAELQRLETAYTMSAELVEVPTYILISTYMTWAMTKPIDPEEPGMPFREMDYRSRKCHPNFKKHFELENEVIEAGKMFPHRFKTLVLCSGIQYGYEEDTLNFLFKLAWENEPALPLYAQGRNFVPLVHIEDLAMMIYNILELFPHKLRYLLAVEQTISSMKSITKAIANELGSEETINLNKEEMFLLNVPQYVYDCLTINIRMEPQYFVEIEYMKWNSTSFVDNIDTLVKEYKELRNLTPIRILLVGPAASGKSMLAKRLCEHYRLHYVSERSVADHVVKILRDKIERIKAKEAAAFARDVEEGIEKELKAGAEDAGEEDGEDASADDEWLDEPEEEAEMPMAALVDTLDDLMIHLEDNEGRLDSDTFYGKLKELLVSPPFKNQGFILDGFPETVEQLKMVFQERELFPMDGEPGVLDYVISLEAPDEFLIDRVMELPEAEIQENHYGEEELMKRLIEFRLENNEDTGIVKVLEEHGVQPIIINVAEDESPFLEETLKTLKETIGAPHNFALSADAAEAEAREKEERRKWVEARDLARKQEAEKVMHTERLRKLEEWTVAMDALRDAEEESFAEDSAALRNYLVQYIFPTLTQGLLEVGRRRPDDPVDFLAEYLFRYNPDGKVFEPDDTHQSRKLYATIRKDIERLYGAKEAERLRKLEEERAAKEFNILDLQVGERPAGTIY